jgi:hypothetical protein
MGILEMRQPESVGKKSTRLAPLCTSYLCTSELFLLIRGTQSQTWWCRDIQHSLADDYEPRKQVSHSELLSVYAYAYANCPRVCSLSPCYARSSRRAELALGSSSLRLKKDQLSAKWCWTRYWSRCYMMRAHLRSVVWLMSGSETKDRRGRRLLR